ncbi:hypothetical protein BOX15_Mlig021941g1 [Macrostomum lignano]|uniref:lysoplasmalogenase n=1 Tax=Macrostomum lignano TaxID=282301 RepID=A0A267DAN6_9PLAT|nr:hypothetical protein BOX15_Mlig022359g1 [Macrostomum lignano]PAA73476.1 hypothetical protein BOX15_Mlig021941g1 [Macrostomum lignano]
MLPQLPIPYHAALQLYSYPVGLYFLNYLTKSTSEPEARLHCRVALAEEIFVKVLPIFTLVFILTKRLQQTGSTKYAERIRKALLWSALGDALLVNVKSDLCAILGAASFIAAHVQYKRAFQQSEGKTGGDSPLSSVLVLLSVPVLLMLGSGHSFILGAMAKGYLVFLFYVMSKAYNRFWHVQQAKSYAAIFGLIGAIAFIASDILLLAKELSAGREGGTFLIMLTYYAAQFGLAVSALE